MQLPDLFRQDRTAAAAEYFDMPATILVKQVFHVFEKFHMTALVTGNGDTLHIFFDGTFDDFGNTAVMAQVNDLGTLGLQDAAHDIDGSIVTIKQTGCGNDADFIFWRVGHGGS
jgi:hypothetical protein